MAGKPREDRSTVHAKHLGIRLNEKEVGWLTAIVRRAEAYWVDSTSPRRLRRKTSPAAVVRSLIAWEFKSNVLYKKRAAFSFVEETIGKLDHLVALANQRNAARGIKEEHTRGTMLMRLIDEEFARRELRPFADQHGARSRYKYLRYGGHMAGESALIGAVEINDRFIVLSAKEKEADARPR